MQEVKQEFVDFKKSLEKRTLLFSTNVINALEKLRYRETTRNLVTQLAKSATSIGANYREANHPESQQDFIHKISITTKEANETVYWLECIGHLDFITENEKILFQPLHKEAKELYALFLTIQQNARNKK